VLAGSAYYFMARREPAQPADAGALPVAVEA
jgi:hypothetical protein